MLPNHIRLKILPGLCFNALGGMDTDTAIALWPCEGADSVNDKFKLLDGKLTSLDGKVCVIAKGEKLFTGFCKNVTDTWTVDGSRLRESSGLQRCASLNKKIHDFSDAPI